MSYPRRMFSLVLLVILLSSLAIPVANASSGQVADYPENIGQGYPWQPFAEATAFDKPVVLRAPAANQPAPGQPQAAPQVSFAAAGAFLNPARIPLSFVPNVGQWDPNVVFQTVGLGSVFSFTPDALLLALPTPTFAYASDGAQPALSLSGDQESMVRLHFEDANPSAQLRAGQPRPGKVNFLLGRDPSNWRSDVPTYARITYAEIYPQIDLHYEGAGVSLKGTYVISPGGDPTRIRWHYEGATRLQIEQASEDLLVELPAPAGAMPGMHVLREHAPTAWQTIAGRRVPVTVAYRLDEDGYVGFDLPNGYELDRPLIIDPTLTYSTFLGGSGHDRAWGIGRDGLGNIYVTGETYSANFPTTPNAWDATCNSCASSHSDVFVFKLNPEGSELIYSTFLGGSGDENSHSAGAIAVDTVGNAYLTGYTASADFPLVGAIQNEFDVNGNAFVAKLSPSGSALHYSTYLGGNGRDIGYGIAVDVDGNAYVTGAASGGFPLVDPLYFSFGDDAFVAKVNPAGSALIYSTYLGGSTLDTGFAIAVDWEGNAYVTGSTLSDDFPVVGGVQAQRSGSGDIFVSKLDRTGRSLVYSTYLGGSNGDGASAIAVDGEGNAVITGSTSSQDFPTTAGAFQIDYGGHRSDAFVAKINAAGDQLVFATYLGGADDENFFDASASIAVDAEGSIYATGSTVSSDFPLVDPLQADIGIGGAAYVVKLNPAGAAIYSTFLGGAGREAGHAIAVDDGGTAYVTGETESANFPTVDPLQGSYGGGPGDVFVAQISHGPGRSVEFDPLHLIFGLYEAGESAPDQTITVYNMGSTPLPIEGVTLIGSHASDFAITATDCDDVTLTPGQSCTVRVSFTPTASGLRFAQVAFESAMWARPRVVGLRGRGAATLELTAESLDLGYQKRGTIGASRTVTLTNVGAGPLAFTVALAGLHPDDFQLTTTCVAPGLAAGASCTVCVAFKPTEDGRRYARVLIAGPDFQQPMVIALNGIGGPAPVLTASRIDTCIAGQLTLSGSNFPYDPAAGVNVIKVHFDDSEVATAHLAADGTFTSWIRVPQGVAGGSHTITAFKMATPDVQATTTVRTMETDLPIIFIPGASGSTLVANSLFLYTAPPDPALYLPIPDPRQLLPALYPYAPGQVMWLDNIGAAATFSGNYRYFDALRLQEDGVSPMPDIFGVVPNVRVGDVLWDVLWFVDIYRGLREFLTQQTYPDGSKRYVEGQTLFYFPYDWRKDPTPTAAALNALIDEARQKSGKDKVVIVAHSMGGLVTRNYLLRYGTAKVDQVITMGTPFLGSVLALKVLEIGDHWGMGWHPAGDMGGDVGVGMHPKQMMKLAQNMGGAYVLFTPPGWYGADALDPYFDPRYVVRSSVVDGKSIEEMLGQRETAQFADHRHNAYLRKAGERFHNQGIGDMSLLTNQYYAQRIIGTELPTYGHVYLSPRQICVTLPFLGLTCLPLPEFAMATLDLRGDDTVPVHSAMGINLRADDERYYFAPNVHHGGLPIDSYVQSMVAQMARGELCSYKDQPLPPRADGAAAATADDALPLRVSGTEILVVGTADLHIYDSAGRHTGPITQTYAIETDILEIGYDTGNGGVIAMLPERGSYTLVLEGRSPAGAAQLRISTMQEGEVTQSLVYETIPVTVTTAATLTLSLPALPVGKTLAFQYKEGDAVQQIGALPLLTGSASRDLIPPVSLIQMNQGVTVTITAEDNADGAGVDKVLYSVNGSVGPFSAYTGPFPLPNGTKEVVAIALDRAGNAEYPGARLNLGPADQLFLPMVRK